MQQRTPIIAIAALTVALVLAVAPRGANAYDDRDGYYAQPVESQYEARRVERSRSYNDEYLFATTRMVNDMDVNPAFKVPLFPPAIVIDLVFLPAEVIAGMF